MEDNQGTKLLSLKFSKIYRKIVTIRRITFYDKNVLDIAWHNCFCAKKSITFVVTMYAIMLTKRGLK